MQSERQEISGTRQHKADPGPRETKKAAFDVAKVEADGAFAGYASLFGTEDLERDLVRRGAFTASLTKRGPAGVRMLFQHDPGEPIGVWDEIREDQRGLFVRGRLMLDVGRAREVHALMKQGALDGLSIGFHTVKATRDRSSGTRHLVEVDLWEISIVTFPMQPGARVSTIKMGDLPTERDLERWLLRDAGLSRRDARALIAGGYKAAFAPKGASSSEGNLAHLAQSIRNASRCFCR
jgi:Escherichia/Staphylococcus phage prohead protease